MSNQEYFMSLALEQANLAYQAGEIPVGAIITIENKIIAKAHNQTERLQDVTAHAEILAITSASNYLGAKYLTQCTLYVTLEPCLMCAGAIFWSQLHSVAYGAKDTKRGFSTLNAQVLHPKTIITQGILEEDCAQLIQNFFQKLRN